jgi:hypothetical protein
MEVIYNWELGPVFAKEKYTDKNGTLRENVVKSVILIYKGVLETEDKIIKEEEKVVVHFDTIDLSDFEDVKNITKDMVFNWGMLKLHPSQKQNIENKIKSYFGESEKTNLIQIQFDE